MRPHAMTSLLVLAGFTALLHGCSGEKNQSQTTETRTEEPAALAGPPIIHDMIAAHGGMDTWRNAPTFAFTDQWGDAPATAFVVEQTSRRAYFDVTGTDIQVAWDGAKAWSMNWPTPTPVRFLALLNYYFINLPWLTQDPGVVLAAPGTGTIPGDETPYITVMMTFEPGTGDTPDDYYRLYIHPETKLLRACDYIVTYQALLDEGQSSTPEHLLVYSGTTTVDGLVLPTGFTIYENGEVYAACTISDYSLATPFDEARMTMPEGAVVDTSAP